jgi:hypothetical protein
MQKESNVHQAEPEVQTHSNVIASDLSVVPVYIELNVYH